MSVDGHKAHLKKEDLDADGLNDMDPFFGGLPSYVVGMNPIIDSIKVIAIVISFP